MTVRRILRPKSHDVEVLVPDTDRFEQQANDAIEDRRFGSRVFRKGERPIKDGWRSTMDELYRRLDICEQEHVGISAEFALRLIGLVENAHATHKKDEAGKPMYFLAEEVDDIADNEEGTVKYTTCKVMILHRPGCCVYMRHRDIADVLGCSRGHVSEQIGLLQHWGFIVDGSQGWIEFDCTLVWRGRVNLIPAYFPAQQINPKWKDDVLKARLFFRDRKDRLTQWKENNGVQ